MTGTPDRFREDLDGGERAQARDDEAAERWDELMENPGRTERGHVACNAPLVIEGHTVGYCGVWVNPRGTRWTRPGWHKGPHRLEWWG